MKIFIIVGENDEHETFGRERWNSGAFDTERIALDRIDDLRRLSKRFFSENEYHSSTREESYRKKTGDSKALISVGTKSIRYWIEEISFTVMEESKFSFEFLMELSKTSFWAGKNCIASGKKMDFEETISFCTLKDIQDKYSILLLKKEEI